MSEAASAPLEPAERSSIIRDSLGVGLATGTYGVSFGAVSVAAGLSVAQTCALSLLMFTGASQFALVGVLASGGSPAHLLAVDYALKPVLAALKAQEMLPGVFAVDKQIAYAEGDLPARIDEELRERLDESLDQLLAALARRPRPIDPQLLNDRLVNARWSI